MLRIFSFDPGGTTGSALFHVEQGVQTVHEHPYAEFLSCMEDQISFWSQTGGLEIVGERFTILPDTHKKTQEGSQQAIGTVEFMRHLARKYHVPFTLQSPFSPAELRAKDALLKRIGWYDPTFNDDGRSAQRHLVKYLMDRHKHIFAQLVRSSNPT